jgi:hypothetical protein
MPGRHHPMTENTGYTLAHAHDLASRVAQAQAIAAELVATAGDLRARAQGERERAQQLAQASTRRDRAGLSPAPRQDRTSLEPLTFARSHHGHR